MPGKEDWIVDGSATTNQSFGCSPNDRPIEELLECGVILIDKPSDHQVTN